MSLQRNQQDNIEIYSISQIFEMYWPQILKMHKAEAKLENDFYKASNYFQRINAIGQYYKSLYDDILNEHEKRPCGFYTSYPLDWGRIFSPIEKLAWESIRYKGNIVLYPQFPALNYHLDFANPGFKIAIELDGKEYHNKEKDFIRDLELKRNGWTIYRITGSEMNVRYKDWFDIEHLSEKEQIYHIKEWILNTGDGVIEAIKQVYFEKIRRQVYDDDNDYDPVYDIFYKACYQTLYNHQS